MQARIPLNRAGEATHLSTNNIECEHRVGSDYVLTHSHSSDAESEIRIRRNVVAFALGRGAD